MTGSSSSFFTRLKDGGKGSLSKISTLGEAHFCIEELFYLANLFASPVELVQALDLYDKYCSGTRDPSSDLKGSNSFARECAVSYLATRRLSGES